MLMSDCKPCHWKRVGKEEIYYAPRGIFASEY
jgi:hypothetical protein